MQFRFGDRTLDLSSPQVMGVLNITPDSFFDGGSYMGGVDDAVKRAEIMVSEGASIVDIGGESTRPGAKPVTEQEECDRILPVIEKISANIETVISVDTSSPVVMRESANLGAGLVNDVRALAREGAIGAAKSTGNPICLMHMKGQPGYMQQQPEYANVVKEVRDYLDQRIKVCCESGIKRERLLVDPGFGFGKNDNHNLALLRSLSYFAELQCPILVGLSRKSMIGRLLKRELKERLAGSLALAFVAIRNGANILRVHDVAETVDIVKIFQLTREHGDASNGA